MTANKLLFYIALLVAAVSAQESDAPSDVPSMSPGGMMTMAPVGIEGEATALPTAVVNTTVCEVCGPGRIVGDTEKEIFFENVSRTCKEIEEIGLAGYLNVTVCEQVFGVFEEQDPCECTEASGPTASPTASVTSSAMLSATVWSAALASLLVVATTTSIAFIV